MQKGKKVGTITVGMTTVDRKDIETAGAIFRAVSHDLRMDIMKVISDKKEVNVNVIYGTLQIEQSITSQHLKILRKADVVKSRRDGKKIYYSLNEAKFTAINSAIKALLKK